MSNNYDDTCAGIEETVDDVVCGLCGYGFDDDKELKQHQWSEHYDVMRLGKGKPD